MAIQVTTEAFEELVGEALDEKRQRTLVNEFFSTAPDGAKGLGDKIEVVSALPLTDTEQADIKKKTLLYHYGDMWDSGPFDFINTEFAGFAEPQRRYVLFE